MGRPSTQGCYHESDDPQQFRTSGGRQPAHRDAGKLIDGSDRIEILVRTRLPPDQGIDPPAAIYPDQHTGVLESEVKVYDIARLHPSLLVQVTQDVPVLVREHSFATNGWMAQPSS